MHLPGTGNDLAPEAERRGEGSSTGQLSMQFIKMSIPAERRIWQNEVIWDRGYHARIEPSRGWSPGLREYWRFCEQSQEFQEGD